MAIRLVFRCEHCDAVPDPATHRTLAGQLRTRTFGEYHDVRPGGWLIWTGSGPLGGKRYACPLHRSALMADTGRHYGALHGAATATEPHATLWPTGFDAADQRSWQQLLTGAG